MMKFVFLKKSKIIGLILIPLSISAQYEIVAKIDLNLDKIIDVIEKDSVTNKIIFEYGRSIENKKKDTILFFSNYQVEAGNLDISVLKNNISFTFTYAPKYLDFDILKFKYNQLKNDWYLTDILSSRTNPLSENLTTEECKYKIPSTLKFSLKKNDFDEVQESLIDNRKYLLKCFKKNNEPL